MRSVLLLRNADVFSPHPLGLQSLLIGGRTVRIESAALSAEVGSLTSDVPFLHLAGPEGLEPPTTGFGDRDSTN